MCRQATLVFAAAVAVGTLASAQPQTELRCWLPDSGGGLRYSKVARSNLLLRPLANGEHLLGSRPDWTFGPFDEDLYCFHTIEVYAADIPGQWPGATSYHHSIEVLVRLVGESNESWWRLTDRTEAAVVADVGDSGGPALAHVRLAVLTGPEPILDIGINSGSGGMITGDQHTSHVIIDLRSSPPPTLGEMVCGETEYRGGPCAFNEYHRTDWQADCVWDRQLDGFRCSAWQTLKLSWTTKSLETCSVLGRDMALACEGLPTQSSRNLAGVLAEAEHGNLAMGSKLQIDELGDVTPLLSVHAKKGAPTFVVFAAPTSDATFEPNLLVARLDANRAPEVLKVEMSFPEAAKAGSGEGEVAKESLTVGLTAKQPPFLVVSSDVALDSGRVRLFRTVIAQGQARGLLLLAIDERDQVPRFGSMLLATDAVLRGKCGDPLHPSTAVAFSKAREDGTFVLDVEPALKEAGIHSSSRDGCRTTSKLRWDHEQGFVQEQTQTDCRTDLRTRVVKIASDGSLHSVEAPPDS